jgi:hypothetical protein
MEKNQHTKGIATVLLFLCVTPGLTRAQSSTPSPMPAPPAGAPVIQPMRDSQPTDDFAGLKFIVDQKAKIDQIHQDMKSRKDAVVKDEKLTVEQRDAMLEGYRRMERAQVFKLLAPEQQREVRARIRARHAAEQRQQNKQSPPK